MNKEMVIGLLAVFLLIVSCSPIPAVPQEKQCSRDADCVPAQCCHAADAVNRNDAPDCSGTFCTLECAPNTLDCGQGEIKCSAGQCVVQLTTSSTN